MKSLYLTASLAIIALPANAAAQSAQSNAAAVNASAQAAQSNASANGAKAAKETKYCVAYEQMVGSRISKSECKTKAQWAQEGVDIEKLLRS